MKIGFMGLGQMGRGMALRLIDGGHQVIAWNRTPRAADSLRQRGAAIARVPEDALDAEAVITMLADDAAVEAVWIESGLAQRMTGTSLHLNMASVSVRMASRLSALHGEHGTPYVSAPVFGRPQAAANGQLDIVAAGPREAITRCTPLFATLGKQWFDVGEDAPRANLVKIARNYLLGTIVESLGEAFALCAKSGIEPERFLEIITSTSLDSPAYRNYGRLIVHPPQSPTFPLTLGKKDIELALEAACDTGVPMPMAALMREQHAAAIDCGYGAGDWAALGNYIAEAAGLPRHPAFSNSSPER